MDDGRGNRAHGAVANAGAGAARFDGFKAACTFDGSESSGMLMKRSILLIAVGAAAVIVLWAQRERPSDQPPYEVRSIFPHETSPAQYSQVEQQELQALADQGWELVSVMPYIYKNEERGSPATSPRPIVTQTYPAYFFKRLKRDRR
jgi:hypothetical protein